MNPVGVDAAVKVINTRCTAAGYIWNPHFTQLADPRNVSTDFKYEPDVIFYASFEVLK